MSHFAENFVGEPIRFSLFWVSATFMLQRFKSRFSVEIFSSQGADKFCRGTLLCFTDFLASKTFMEKKGGEYQEFPSKGFCLTLPKNFVGEPISV